jgi:anti-sigma-K factor RskA
MNFDELSRESILLLYQSGELPEEKRAQVEHMLEHDAALREQLEALHAAHGAVVSAFSIADAMQPMPASELAAATRNTLREVRQWQVDRANRPAPAPARRAWRIDWRAYTLASAAAAVLAVGLFVLFGTSDEQTPINPTEEVSQMRADADSDENPLVERFALAIEQTMVPPAARGSDIEQAEQAMSQLRDLTELSRSGNIDSELQ